MCELVKAAHKKAMGDFRYMKNLEKWEQAPVLYDIKAFGGKNAVGDFGEYLVDEYYTSQGVDSVVVKCGHDVRCGDKKIEVKTAFENGKGGFFFNQIYYADVETHADKDWDHLIFVFVSPTKIELWECQKPENPTEHFNKNNGFCWHKSSSDKLDKSIWTKIAEMDPR